MKIITLIFLAINIFCMKASFGATTEASVVINASIDKVWDFIRDDRNAKNWSIFFAKIIPCPVAKCPKNKNLTPADIGFIRRAFRNVDEKGLFWDEENILIKKNTNFYYKKIRAHNFYGYFGKKYQKSWEMNVEQEYKTLSPNKTKLTFKSSPFKYENLTKKDVSKLEYWLWSSSFKIFARSRTQKIFKKNLENIKHNIENGVSGHPVYPYQKTCDARFFACPNFISDL